MSSITNKYKKKTLKLLHTLEDNHKLTWNSLAVKDTLNTEHEIHRMIFSLQVTLTYDLEGVGPKLGIFFINHENV